LVFFPSDLTVELPFTLTHPKPPSPYPSPVLQRRYSEIAQGIFIKYSKCQNPVVKITAKKAVCRTGNCAIFTAGFSAHAR